ncbi:OmpA family protein [Polaribacter sp. IC073]|uniref:OmpA family protein n=1 Tax=Polaribacter sp. IC073 TaxID=2508540 RepID=UPI0011BF2F8F|nr:OmpA family protein [Polaribacter sp. IC073]TXD47746.1 OmpA family protein [Polaribacter sp. IC073]
MTFIVLFGLSCTMLHAQNTATNNDWLLHLGANAVDDGGDTKLSTLFRGDNLNFTSPFIFGIEYVNNSKFSFTSNVSFNKYTAGKNIDNRIILQEEAASYLAVDMATKYKFVQPLTSNTFEPYVFLGLGYTKIGKYIIATNTVPSVGRLTINSGVGANYWLSDSFGLNLDLAGKFGIKSGKHKEYISNQTQVSFGVFYSFKLKRERNSKNDDKKVQLVPLVPIKCFKTIHVTIIDEETKKPIPNPSIAIFKNDVLIETLKTTTAAAYSFKIDCNNYYSIQSSVANYENASIVIKSSKLPNQSTTVVIRLKPIVDIVTTSDKKMIHTDPIYFDLNSSIVEYKAKIELDKVVQIMKKYPAIVVEIGSHTDSRASAKYNIWLSDRRAASTIKYIVTQGISASRLSGKGYGETQLINKCSNGVKCTEDQHKLNRRTEFIIKDE